MPIGPWCWDDLELEKDGQVKPPGWWIESHDGREGSIRLVNGRQEPEVRIAANTKPPSVTISAGYVVPSPGL